MVVKREHTAANVAPAIRQLKEQIDKAFPNRKHDSDGIWPSPAHTAASPNSDHEAGNALDITDDLGDGKHVDVVVAAIVGDPRLKYVIHDGRKWEQGRGWRDYLGANPHTGHMHVSVLEEKRRDDRPWDIGTFPRFKPCTETPPRSGRVLLVTKNAGARVIPGWAAPVRYGVKRGNHVKFIRARGDWFQVAGGPKGKAAWVHRKNLGIEV